MEIIFLGTSAGVPTRQRNVTAIVLKRAASRHWYLIDCGEATQHRLLHTPLSLVALNGICITHIHGDHCYGLPGLLATAGTQGRTAPLTLVAPAAIKAYLDGISTSTGLQLPYELEFHAVESLAGGFELGEFQLSALPLSHRVPSWGYDFTEAPAELKLDRERLAALEVPRGPQWGALQRGETVRLSDGRSIEPSQVAQPAPRRRRVFISGDNDRPELIAPLAPGLDVLVHEATYTQAVADRVEPGPQHSSAASIAGFAERARLPNLILTHFSQRYHNSRPDGERFENLTQEARDHYQGTLFFAEDFARFQLDQGGQLTSQGYINRAGSGG